MGEAPQGVLGALSVRSWPEGPGLGLVLRFWGTLLQLSTKCQPQRVGPTWVTPSAPAGTQGLFGASLRFPSIARIAQVQRALWGRKFSTNTAQSCSLMLKRQNHRTAE